MVEILPEVKLLYPDGVWQPLKRCYRKATRSKGVRIVSYGLFQNEKDLNVASYLCKI